MDAEEKERISKTDSSDGYSSGHSRDSESYSSKPIAIFTTSHIGRVEMNGDDSSVISDFSQRSSQISASPI